MSPYTYFIAGEGLTAGGLTTGLQHLLGSTENSRNSSSYYLPEHKLIQEQDVYMKVSSILLWSFELIFSCVTYQTWAPPFPPKKTQWHDHAVAEWKMTPSNLYTFIFFRALGSWGRWGGVWVGGQEQRWLGRLILFSLHPLMMQSTKQNLQCDYTAVQSIAPSVQ